MASGPAFNRLPHSSTAHQDWAYAHHCQHLCSAQLRLHFNMSKSKLTIASTHDALSGGHKRGG